MTEASMTSEALYLHDHYLREFDATVIAAEENRIALDRTAFYPTGGGQPCDTGTLAESRVVEVRRRDGMIWHTLEGSLPEVGARVHGELDWERRYALMRTHTALHVLCGVIYRDYGAPVTGGNMEPLSARMDFELESMRAELVAEIERRVNEEVVAARPVVVEFLDRGAAEVDPELIRTKVNLLPPEVTQVRVVEIVGLDKQADGGTHVANTAEIGEVRIVDYKSKGRLNKRLRIALSPAPPP